MDPSLPLGAAALAAHALLAVAALVTIHGSGTADRAMWSAVVVLLPLFGPLLWWLLGSERAARAARHEGTGRGPARGSD